MTFQWKSWSDSQLNWKCSGANWTSMLFWLELNSRCYMERFFASYCLWMVDGKIDSLLKVFGFAGLIDWFLYEREFTQRLQFTTHTNRLPSKNKINALYYLFALKKLPKEIIRYINNMF